tara:strand:+ start:50 stop:583 length:534 start_codon:yes stop_codon:yes gene_type:complete
VDYLKDKENIMSATRAVRRFVREHVSDLRGREPKTGEKLTPKQIQNRQKIERPDARTAGRRSQARKSFVAGASTVIAGLTAKKAVDKLTAQTEKSNPVTKAGARNALRGLGAAYRESVKNAQSGETSRKAVEALSKSKLTAFEKAFAAAAKRGDKTFKFEVNGVMKPFTVTYKKNKK